MPDDLTRLEQWVQQLIEKLGPAERRRLTLALAREMLAAQRTTMAAQTAPDGTPWQPRKAPARTARGAIRRKAQAARARQPMMRGLRRPRWLKAKGTEGEAIVQFIGSAARIAALHQYGGPDQVEPGGPTYDYPARPLIGIPDALAERLRQRLLDHLIP